MHALQTKVRDYLLQQWPECDAVEIQDFRDLPGGYSKFTYSFDARITKAGETRMYPMILRIDSPQVSAIFSNSRQVEHLALSRLREHTRAPVPISYFVEMRPEIFGAPAMIVERAQGSTKPTELFTNPERAGEAEQLATELCEKIAALHTSDVRVLNRDGAFNDPRGTLRSERGRVHRSGDIMAWMAEAGLCELRALDLGEQPAAMGALVGARP